MHREQRKTKKYGAQLHGAGEVAVSAPALEVDVAVVGAGVVGMAIAAELTRRGAEVVVLERHDGPGRETTSRNSQVVHSGLYYQPGSLKARLCVRGKELLYRFCEDSGVEYQKLGKVVVAARAELPDLEALHQRAQDNGATDLELLTKRELAQCEPRVLGYAALLCNSTGIVDAHGLVKALEARVGGTVLYRSELVAAEAEPQGFSLEVARPEGRERLRCHALVNAAGLFADRVAAMAGDGRFHLHWAKGEYFRVPTTAAAGVSRLVYPLPRAGLAGLGIHVTFDLAGRMLLGPDVSFLEQRTLSYDVDSAKALRFREAATRLLPHLAHVPLVPDFAGIRPKLSGPGEPARDFLIESSPKITGLFNVIGIESPGLTSALAIAEFLTQQLVESGHVSGL